VAVAALLMLIWNGAIYFDSSALTAGTMQAAGREELIRRFHCRAIGL
jgi:hypothetical protein